MHGITEIPRLRKFSNWLLAQQQLQQEQEAARKKAQPTLVITISRQLGCHGTEIARRLGEALGWEVWEREIVDKIAKDIKAHRSVVELLDERAVSSLAELSRALFHSSRTVSSEVYLRALFGTLISIAHQGRAIIVGRGGNLILPKALNVRLTASFDYRLKSLMQQRDWTEEEAENRIVRSDQGRADFVRMAFGADVDDAALYDMIIRMNEFQMADVVEIIKAATHRRCPIM